MKKITILLLGTAVWVHADTVVSSFGTVSGEDDADQAGPMWGMSITPNERSKPAGKYKELFLKSMSFQTSSSGSGANYQEKLVYLQVYDQFKVDASGKITELGRLVTNSINAIGSGSENAGHKTLTWKFDGSTALKGDKNYMFIMSTERTKVATVADHANLVSGAFELKPENPYTGGIGFLANSDRSDWDLEFRAEFSTTPHQVTPPSAVIGLGEFNFLLRDTSD